MARLEQLLVPGIVMLFQRLHVISHANVERDAHPSTSFDGDVEISHSFGEGEEGAAGHEDDGGGDGGFAVPRRELHVLQVVDAGAPCCAFACLRVGALGSCECAGGVSSLGAKTLLTDPWLALFEGEAGEGACCGPWRWERSHRIM